MPHPTKLVITGNHEAGPFSEFDPKKAATQLSNATFLDLTPVVVEGVCFFGIPWKRQFSAGKVLRQWALAGNAVDVMISHEPPKDVLDKGMGCATIRELCAIDGNLAVTTSQVSFSWKI